VATFSPAASAPEPESMRLLGAGLAGLAIYFVAANRPAHRRRRS
jgi:hypothetical protein